MGGAGGFQRGDMYGLLHMCPKGIIRNGTKMYKMLTLALFIAAEEKPQWLGRKCFYKLWSTIIKSVKTVLIKNSMM